MNNKVSFMTFIIIFFILFKSQIYMYMYMCITISFDLNWALFDKKKSQNVNEFAFLKQFYVCCEIVDTIYFVNIYIFYFVIQVDISLPTYIVTLREIKRDIKSIV